MGKADNGELIWAQPHHHYRRSYSVPPIVGLLGWRYEVSLRQVLAAPFAGN